MDTKESIIESTKILYNLIDNRLHSIDNNIPYKSFDIQVGPVFLCCDLNLEDSLIMISVFDSYNPEGEMLNQFRQEPIALGECMYTNDVSIIDIQEAILYCTSIKDYKR